MGELGHAYDGVRERLNELVRGALGTPGGRDSDATLVGGPFTVRPDALVE